MAAQTRRRRGAGPGTTVPSLCLFLVLVLLLLSVGVAVADPADRDIPGQEGGEGVRGPGENAAAPAVKVLTDRTFEHATQAATGQTTGRWLVLFTGPACRACREIEGFMVQAAEASGALIPAKIDVEEHPVTAKRFGVTQVPALKLLRDRQLYSCTSCYASAEDLSHFVEEGYKDLLPEPVPGVASLLDDLAVESWRYYNIALKFVETNATAQMFLLVFVAYGAYLAMLRVLKFIDPPKHRRRRSGVPPNKIRTRKAE